jgi:hypothetical protein
MSVRIEKTDEIPTAETNRCALLRSIAIKGFIARLIPKPKTILHS